jgi:hypothetical protein
MHTHSDRRARHLALALIALLPQSIVTADDMRISVKSSPSKAQIFVNGTSIDRKTPTTITVQPGDTITLRRPAYHEHSVKVQQGMKAVNEELIEKTQLRMLVEVKTANRIHAGTDDLTLAIWLNGDPELRCRLDNKRDNHRVGAIDRYTVDVDCAPSKLKGIRLIAESGDDAWACDYVAVRFMIPEDDLISNIYAFPLGGRKISADVREGRLGHDLLFRSRPRFTSIGKP